MLYICNLRQPLGEPSSCGSKKGGFTVIRNEKNELIPTRIVTRWRLCIDYRKLNTITRKDHHPLPFIDKMLDRLVGQPHFYFLDGYSGYNQIADGLEVGVQNWCENVGPYAQVYASRLRSVVVCQVLFQQGDVC